MIKAIFNLCTIELDLSDILQIGSPFQIKRQSIQQIALRMSRVDSEKGLIRSTADKITIRWLLVVVEWNTDLTKRLYRRGSRSRR